MFFVSKTCSPSASLHPCLQSVLLERAATPSFPVSRATPLPFHPLLYNNGEQPPRGGGGGHNGYNTMNNRWETQNNIIPSSSLPLLSFSSPIYGGLLIINQITKKKNRNIGFFLYLQFLWRLEFFLNWEKSEKKFFFFE